MTSLAHPLGVAVLMALAPLQGSAQSTPPDSATLEFRGFRAGARLDELRTLVQRRDGGRLRCARAKRDRRVSECRTTVHDAELGGAASLWISAIDSTAGVITLSRTVDAGLLDRWREAIERRYGRVDATAQGSQWMMQWVRRGRMLRLTWRLERGKRVASVSLVDGRVLDGWHDRAGR